MIKPLSPRLPSGEEDAAMRPVAFQKILERERMRADRCEMPISVLVFTADAGRAARRDATELARFLQHRLRSTDVVGRLDGRRLATLLFDTPPDGARTVLKAIQSGCPAMFERHTSAIHTYPLDASDNADEPKEEGAALAPREMLFTQPMPVWKRLADLFLASSSLIVFAPLMAVAAVMIKLSSPGPVLFCQRRAGLAGEPFVVYKFRTMCDGASAQQAALREQSEQDGPAFKLKHDPRVTWVGKYLRKTCIDEFPQFWNVLRGEMSIVGPRPLPLDESADCSRWQRRRLDVTPGMTCIWQVSGGMRVSFIEWMRMDLRYIRQRTLWHDFKLLLQTAKAILFHRASQ